MAAPQYWDPAVSHTALGSGGTGTWDTVTANWYPGSGSTDATWAGDTAWFAGTAGSVTVISTGVSANEMLFQVTGDTIGGGTINLEGVTAGAGVMGFSNGGSLSETVSAPLAGAVELLVQGGAGGTGDILTLTGSCTYTGSTTNNGAALVLGNTNASTSMILNGGSSTLNFTLATAPTSNIVNSSAAVTLNYGATFSLDSKSGSANGQSLGGGLTIGPGASTLSIVNGNGSATGSLNVGAITRNVGGTANFVQPTVNTTISAANGYSTSTSNDAYGLLGPGLTVGGTDWAYNNGTNIVALPSANYTIQNNASSWGANQNLTNNAAYSGTLGGNLTIGSLRFNSAAASSIGLGGSTLTLGDGILVTSTVGANASTITGGALTAGSANDLVVIQNDTNAAGALTIAASIVDNGSPTALTKSGGGILTLSGSSSYSGGTYFNAGTLNIKNNNAVGTGSLDILSGTTFDNTSGSAVTLPATNTLFLGTPGSASIGTFAGSNGGILNLAAGGATIEFTTAVANLESSGNSFTLDVNAGTLNIEGSLNATAGGDYNYILSKTGLGALVLSGVNNLGSASTATGGKIQFRGGTLVLDNALALDTGGLTIATGGSGTLALDNSTSAPITLSNNPALTVQLPFTFIGTQSLNYGTGAVSLQNTSPTITVIANTLTFGGVISGSFGITKAGAGSLVLGGANTYTTGTTVSAGTLVVNNTTGSGLGTGSVTVSGGTLSGTGTFSGDLHIAAGGTLAPGLGSSFGTLANTSPNAADLTAGNLTITLGTTASQVTQLRVSNGASLGGTLTLLDPNDGPNGAPLGTVYTIINNVKASGGITGTFSGLANGGSIPDSNGIDVFTINYSGGDGNDVTLTETATPEPGTLGLLGIGASGLLLRRRRQTAAIKPA